MVTWDGFEAPRTQYYLDYQDGPYGYITSVEDPRYCIHPHGGAVDAGNNTSLVFHEDRHPGAYFRFDQDNGVIVHVSGRYWNPHGGSSNPGNNNGVVLWDSWSNATRFQADNGTNQVKFSLPIAATSLGWRLVFASDHPITDETASFTKTVGRSSSKSSTIQYSASVTEEIKTDILGMASKTTATISSAYEQTDEKTWSDETSENHTFNVKAGNPVAVWQRIYTAKLDDGTVWTFESGSIEYQTTGSKVFPPGDA